MTPPVATSPPVSAVSTSRNAMASSLGRSVGSASSRPVAMVPERRAGGDAAGDGAAAPFGGPGSLRGFSFSSSLPRGSLPRGSLVSSSAAAGSARPPRTAAVVAPPPKAQQLFVGFDAPAAAAAAATVAPPASSAPAVAIPAASPFAAVAGTAGPLSPGRREMGPGLLSMALSDLPASTARSLSFSHSLEGMFGALSPSASLAAATGVATEAEAAAVAPAPELEALVARHAVFDSPVVRAAYAAAARAHAGRARKSGEPALAHCLAVAEIVAGLGLPADAVAAALLHDAVSRGLMAAAQLEEHVPRACAEMVSLRGGAGRVRLVRAAEG